VAIGKIPFAILTKGTWEASECRYWPFQLFHWLRVSRLSPYGGWFAGFDWIP
jgi:hypothetical protein